MKTVAVLVYEGCWAMNVFLVNDLFRIVSLVENHLGLEQSYQVRNVSIDGGKVVSACGAAIFADSKLTDHDHYDLIVIPAMEGTKLENPPKEYSQITNWLSPRIIGNMPVLSMSTAAYLIARTGHASKVLMATHWAFARKLSQLFTESRFTSHESYLMDENLYTTGSLSGATDALLGLIAQDKGNDFAQLVASHLLLNSPKNLSPILPGTRNHTDEQILNIQQWIEQNYLDVVSIEQLATRFGFSERNLKRRFKGATKLPVIQYLQKVKIDKAKKLLLSTNLSVKEIAYQVGYTNDSFFSKLFRSQTGESPGLWKQSVLATGS
ncbi:transcriptional regulator [Oleiphilus messinensis]|uniref:Transcriptional regulator n=1 Tax=Oleiphilus messinensis TaxID=141451 RepID=A0A1Y0IA58_9GAMM|nr:helix-turn-helix domain-containing protein [Oleiphilus messinensis]ARU57398.1 transcriptional regulator [Oleiphilus messinensis]